MRDVMWIGGKLILSLAVTLAITCSASLKADLVTYTLDNIVLDRGTQLEGEFTWTYDPGDFENGTAVFSFLSIPYTAHDETDLVTTVGLSLIEITFAGNLHDDGVDIALVLASPLSPTMPSPLDLSQTASKYSIGGNGFHDGFFISGRITPTAVPEGNALGLMLVAALAASWCYVGRRF